MTTVTTSATEASLGPSAAKVAGLVAAFAVAANLAVYALARVAGVSFDVVRPDGAAFTIGAVPVVLMTVVPLALGGIALAVASRRGARAWAALAWIGLGLGVISVAMPVSADAEAGTKLALASMHALTAAIWFLLVRRSK